MSIVTEKLEHITMLLYPLCSLYSNPSQIPFNLQGYIYARAMNALNSLRILVSFWHVKASNVACQHLEHL
jgi:hypothetical protein